MELNGAADLRPAAEASDEPQVALSVTPEVFPGVWANYAEIARTEHEITLDFYRIGPGGQQGMCVSRVNCSPLMLEQLEISIAEQRAAMAESSS